MAQDHGLCRKKVRVKTMNPAHGPPLQARVAAANGTVLQLANMLVLSWATILAHMEGTNGAKHNERGQSKLERDKLLMRAVGMAGKGKQAHSPQNQAAAGKHSQRILRPAQA